MKTKAMIRALSSVAIAAALTLPVLPARASSTTRLPQGDQKKMMHDKLQETVNDLNLTDDQKSKLKDIFSDANSKRDAIFNDSSLTSDQKKAKMKELHTATMAKVNELLTPEQRTQLKEKLEAAKTKTPPSNY